MGKIVNLTRLTARVRIGAGRLMPLGLIAIASASSVPAMAQTARSASSDPITVIGRARAAEPSVFGTVAVPFGTTPMSARWTRVLTAQAGDSTLTRLTASARTLSAYQKAAFIQSVVNRGVRNHSRPKCTDDGYWAAARESLARGIGDCVDIAIAKMEALRQLGFSASDLYLTTGRSIGSNSLEAALLVRIGEQFYFLDSRSDQMIGASSATFFTPIVTYGSAMTWAHGVPVNGPRMLSRPQTIARASDPAPQPRAFSGLDGDVKAAIRSLTPSK